MNAVGIVMLYYLVILDKTKSASVKYTQMLFIFIFSNISDLQLVESRG